MIFQDNVIKEYLKNVYFITGTHDKERMLADSSRGRVSVKEKLAEMSAKISKEKNSAEELTKREKAPQIKKEIDSL